MKIDLKNLTIRKAHEHLVKRDFTARELAEAYLKEIKHANKDLNVYLEVYDDVLKQADEAQKLVKEGNVLAGIPIAVKDNILIKGRKVSSASKILEGYVAPYDATAIEKLKKMGVVFIGRANMDEFALGGSTEKSAYGVTKNPHDTSRVPGGTSGGSAASVGGNLALASLGSDTGGSVRQPASFCGVVGLKPTYGSISRHGLMAAASSLDVIGPIGNTVDDVEILFNAMRGKDAYDSTSIDIDAKHVVHKKMRVGVPQAFLKGDGMDPRVLEVFEKTVADLKEKGCEIKDVELPNISYSLPVYYIINFAEVSTNLSRFDGVKYGLHKDGAKLIDDYLLSRGGGFGPEARRRIMLGAYVLSSGYYDAYYNKANMVRELLKNEFKNVFKEVDVIITPTAPTPAFKIGEKVSDPVSMYLEDIFTVPANLVGIPAISLPVGFKQVEDKKLPIGVQLMANHGREDVLFSVSKVIMGEVK